MIPDKMVKGMGGAMDFVAGVKRVVVLTEHTGKGDAKKILRACTWSLIRVRCARRILTQLGIFDTGHGSRVIEFAQAVGLAEVQANSGVPSLS